MLVLDQLGYVYGKRPVLSDVSLCIAAGEVVCLVGPNGAGKSTLIKCINGLLKPTSGRVELHGKPVGTFGRFELARTMAYVPQQTRPTASLTVVDSVALGRMPHSGLSSKVRDREIVWHALKRLDLVALAFRNLGELSGGERQRVLLARALAQEASLLLMDEPANNLDPFYQLETASIVRELVEAKNIAALLVLHDLSLTAQVADTVVLMQAGRLVAHGRWQDVLDPDLLRAVFGVRALIGTTQGVNFVVPF